MSRDTFTPAAIARAAQKLGVDEATIRAVAEVESNGSGFLADGRPKILFERHIFSRLTNRRFDQAHPDISNPDPGDYDGGVAEYMRLYRAMQLDGDAAAMATSFGTFQTMGFNWAACGEKSLTGFLLAMHHDADAHLGLFVGFLLSQRLDEPLRRQDWAGFAAKYNGPSFARNHYDAKLVAAHDKWKAAA